MSRYIDAEKLKDDIAVLFERNEKLIDDWLANCVDDVIDEQTTVELWKKEDNQLPVNKNRNLCKLRHKNGNCLCVGGFCTAVNDEICKSIKMSYEKGYVDGKIDADVKEVKRGRWELGGERGFPKWTCTVCGGVGRGDYLICPWCGSYMNEVENE